MSQPENNKPRDNRQVQNSVIDLSKKARQKLRSRRYEEAMQLFRRGLEIEPENPYLLSGMGDACRESGDFHEAERCYIALLDVDQKNLFALRGLGDVYKKLNRHQDAIELWETYLTLRSRDKHVMTRIADSFKVLQLFEQAEKTYRQILTFAPQDRFALTGLGDLLHRLGKDDEAIETYERVLSFDANELHILTIIGKLCWRISDFERSEGYFRRALAIDPKNPYALYGLGNCFRWSKDYEKALEIWQKILEFSDGTQALHTRMGDAYINIGCQEKAESCYIKALTFDEDIYSTAGLICLYSERREWDKAAKFFSSLVADENEGPHRFELLCKRFLHFNQEQTMRDLFLQLKASGQCTDQILDLIEQQLNIYRLLEN